LGYLQEGRAPLSETANETEIWFDELGLLTFVPGDNTLHHHEFTVTHEIDDDLTEHVGVIDDNTNDLEIYKAKIK